MLCTVLVMVMVQTGRESDGDVATKCLEKPERAKEMHIAMLETLETQLHAIYAYASALCASTGVLVLLFLYELCTRVSPPLLPPLLARYLIVRFFQGPFAHAYVVKPKLTVGPSELRITCQ